MLFYILEKDRPDAVVVALDSPGKTFRHAEFAEYKGTRREIADELRTQLIVSRDLIAALGIPSVECPGFEADDIVGTIAKLGEDHGYQTTIVTGDLDSLQLVDDNIRVMTMQRGVTEVIFYGREEVINRYGFGPEYIPDYKAIVGDKSDNIPGVPGIGDKGATQLIQQFGTVENILDKWEEVDPKLQKKIEPAKEQMLQSKWLATIQTNAPLEDFDFEPFKLTNEEYEAAMAFLEMYELKSHIRRMPQVLGKYREGFEGEPTPVEVARETIQVQLEDAKTYEELDAWVQDKPFAMLLEPATGQMDLYSEEASNKVYVAIGEHVRYTSEEFALKLLETRPQNAILHDSKPWIRKLANKPNRVRFDSMLAGYVLQSGRSNYVLRDLVQGYLEVTPPTTLAEMTAALYQLESPMRDRLKKENQESVLDEIELPLTPILAQMEEVGIAVDAQVLGDFSKKLEAEIQELATKIYDEAKVTFNIASPKQLGEVLFEKMMIPGVKRGKTGYPTGAEVLQPLAPAYPIIANVLSYRELTKLKGTYADALPKLIKSDGRIHTTYAQAVAATGRLSSNDPNLQNIPIRTEIGRSIRKAFVAAERYKLASFDYSQIELRILAEMCGDEALVQAFQRRVDVHTVTASLMYGISEDQVTKEQRRLAKLLNYAVLYGVTEYGLANQLGGGFSTSEARALIEQYRERFPSVKAFTDATIAEARSKGFTTTIRNRRRYFPDIHNANRNERMYAERQAMNAPLQGTASDLIKLAMIAIPPLLEGRKTRMLLQVHDELVFELADGEEDLIEPIRNAMEQGIPEIKIPIEVDVKIGANWDEMTEVPRA